jgi:hypothetical protein
MRKLLFIIFIFFILGGKAYSASATPSVYKVTMLKVVLCENGSSDTSCSNPVTLGEGSKEVDIASVEAGEAAGSFGSSALVEAGKTYTYMQVTLDRKMTIKGFVTNSGQGNACYTQTSDPGTLTVFATGSTSSSDLAEQVMYVPHTNGSTGNYAHADLNSKTNTITINMSNVVTGLSANNSESSGGAGSVDSDDTKFQYRMELTSPFTPGIHNPRLEIAFDVTNAMTLFEDAGGNCNILPDEPTVSITLK